MIRAIVVHQTPLIANIMASVLSDEIDIHVVARASSEEEVNYLLEKTDCNLVLVSARLPNQGALALTKNINQKSPEIIVLVFGLPESESLILEYIMAGASGYVLQDVPKEQLIKNMRAAYNDEAIISPTMAATLMNQIAELASISTSDSLEPSAVLELTPREKEVLGLIGEGLTNKEISQKLYIEVGTVKNHVHNLLKKLEVSSRTEATDFIPLLENEEKEGAV